MEARLSSKFSREFDVEIRIQGLRDITKKHKIVFIVDEVSGKDHPWFSSNSTWLDFTSEQLGI